MHEVMDKRRATKKEVGRSGGSTQSQSKQAATADSAERRHRKQKRQDEMQQDRTKEEGEDPLAHLEWHRRESRSEISTNTTIFVFVA